MVDHQVEEPLKNKCKQGNKVKNRRSASADKREERLSAYEKEPSMTDEELLNCIADIRLFHRRVPGHYVASLSSMPFHLCDGKVVGSLPMELDETDTSFLTSPANILPHQGCSDVNGDWICKGAGFFHKSVRNIGAEIGYGLSQKLTIGATSQQKDQNLITTGTCATSVDPKKHSMVYENVTEEQVVTRTQDQNLVVGTSDVSDLKKHKIVMKDVPKEQVVLQGHGAGLVNLGYTCYASSAIQCLSSVHELTSYLQRYAAHTEVTCDLHTKEERNFHELTKATCDLLHELGQSDRPIYPKRFIESLRKAYPMFAANENGVYEQQDADECLMFLLDAMDKRVSSVSSGSIACFIKKLFQMDLLHTGITKGGDQGSFPEFVHSITIQISGDVQNLNDGLQQYLASQVQNSSPFLQGSALGARKTTIDELPRYLMVQFVRTVWNEDLAQTEKVLQKVEYPSFLDLYNHCSTSLKEKLDTVRKITWESSNKGTSSAANQELIGKYELLSLLTHDGQTVNSGHYIAWKKRDDGIWLSCDDAEVTPRQESDALKFAGGEDGHMAVILLYRGVTENGGKMDDI